MDRSRDWLAPLTGVVFIVLAIVGFAIQGEPPTAADDPVEEIVSHYVDNEGSVMFGSALATIAALFLVFFFGYLRKVLRAAEGEGGVLSLISFAGAVVLAVGVALDSTIAFALAETADDIDPTAVQALQALWDNDFLPLALGVSLLMLATGLSVVRHGALPKWLGWVAIVIGVVGITPIGFFAFLVAAIWILVVSVMLTMRARAAQTPATP
jgi:Domain of unknown function (DUF4386)